MKFLWQQQKTIFRVDKTAKPLDEQTKEKLTLEGKGYFSFFSRFWAKFFINFQRKSTGMVVKTATYVILEDFEDKQFLKNCTKFQTSSDFKLKIVGPLVEKTFSGFFYRLSSFLRNKVRKCDFSFEKVLFFLV